MQPTRLPMHIWQCGEAVAALIVAPLLPNVQTCREPGRLDSMALRATSSTQGQGSQEQCCPRASAGEVATLVWGSGLSEDSHDLHPCVRSRDKPALQHLSFRPVSSRWVRAGPTEPAGSHCTSPQLRGGEEGSLSTLVRRHALAEVGHGQRY